MLDRIDAQPELVEFGPPLLHQRAHVRPGGELEERLVAGETAIADQIGAFDFSQAQIDARGDGGEDEGFARDLLQRADDLGREVADADDVADLGPVLDEHALLDESAAGPELPGRVRRIGLKRSIEGKRTFERPHLDQPAALAGGKTDHRGEAGFAGLLAAEFTEEFFLPVAKRLPGTQHQIGPEKTLRLEPDRCFKILTKRRDGDERTDAQDDG